MNMFHEKSLAKRRFIQLPHFYSVILIAAKSEKVKHFDCYPLKRQPPNCLSVFDRFVKLTLKALKYGLFFVLTVTKQSIRDDLKNSSQKNFFEDNGKTLAMESFLGKVVRLVLPVDFLNLIFKQLPSL